MSITTNEGSEDDDSARKRRRESKRPLKNTSARSYDHALFVRARALRRAASRFPVGRPSRWLANGLEARREATRNHRCALVSYRDTSARERTRGHKLDFCIPSYMARARGRTHGYAHMLYTPDLKLSPDGEDRRCNAGSLTVSMGEAARRRARRL